LSKKQVLSTDTIKTYEVSLPELFSSLLVPNTSAPFLLDSQTVYMPQLTLYDASNTALGSGGDGFVQINANGLLEMTLTDGTKNYLNHTYFLEATFAPSFEETHINPLINLTNA
jgi:hypothetical protein